MSQRVVGLNGDVKGSATATPSCRGRMAPMKLTLLWTLAVTVAAATFDNRTVAQSRAPGTCSRGDVFVQSANPQQIREACEAVSDVLTYFDGIGFKVEPHVSIAFWGDVDAKGGRKHAHGSYDPAARAIKLYAREQARPWGEPWQDVGGSFIRHEVAHAVVVQILAMRGLALPREWHEFIAYAVQFELMEPAIRASILERYSNLAPASALTQINPFTHGLADPDTFAVLVFKSYSVFGGRDLVRRLLTAEFVPTPLERMIPFPPN